MWRLIKEALFSVWYLVTGILLFGRQWRKQKKLASEMDLKYHYKQKVKKQTNLQSVQEKNMIGAELKKLTKAERNNYSVFNYITTLVYRMRPGMTMKDGIKEFYTFFHPWFISYHSAFKMVKMLIHSKDPELEFRKRLPTLKHQFGKRLDVFHRADFVMERYKKVVQDISQEEKKLKRDRMKKTDTVDKKVLEKEREIMQSRIDRDKEIVSNLEKAIKDNSKSIEGEE